MGKQMPFLAPRKKKTNFEYKAFLDILTYVQVNKSIYQKSGKSA